MYWVILMWVNLAFKVKELNVYIFGENFICTNSKFVNDLPVKILDIFEKSISMCQNYPHINIHITKVKSIRNAKWRSGGYPEILGTRLNALEMGTIRINLGLLVPYISSMNIVFVFLTNITVVYIVSTVSYTHLTLPTICSV